VRADLSRFNNLLSLPRSTAVVADGCNELDDTRRQQPGDESAMGTVFCDAERLGGGGGRCGCWLGWAGDFVRDFEVVHADEGLLVGVHRGEKGASAEGVEAAGIFDGDHGHLAVDHLELGAVALGLALGDELFVNDDGELGGINFAAVSEGGELGEEGLAPGEVRGVAEEEGGRFGGLGADESDCGPAALGDDVFELLGEDGVNFGEVRGDGGAGGGGWDAGKAAGGLILLEHGEEMRAEGGDDVGRGVLGGPGGGLGGGLGCGRCEQREEEGGGLQHGAILRVGRGGGGWWTGCFRSPPKRASVLTGTPVSVEMTE